MSDAKDFLKQLFKTSNGKIPVWQDELLDKFVLDKKNLAAIQEIYQNQDNLMARWEIEKRITEIIEQPVRILNATVGKSYETKFDFEKFNWKDISAYEFAGLEETGLIYDEEAKQIMGVPTKSGDIRFAFKFKIAGQPDDASYNEKIITLIINHDPKSLWKNIESDKNDPYWKEDNITVFSPLGEKHILVSCKRGRSHANVGAFREDDFAFKELENGWKIVVVGDGAGSAKFSRKGSAIACRGIVEYFSEQSMIDSMLAFDELITHHNNQTGDDIENKLNLFVYNNLGKAAFSVHKKLEEFAAKEKMALKDLNSTLVFSLFKKFDPGYAFLSFGVGDCPMGVLNKDLSKVTLLNWIDVGDYGGGTRFITMPEIFQSEKFSSRLSFKLLDDFSYLILMSDGIYDPKFVVETNLEKVENWQKFLADLNGQNDDEGAKVVLKEDNENIVTQFSRWMDFWSPGNHDDRTLAIVF